MARTPAGPWWNKGAGEYNVTIDKVRYPLGKDIKEAREKFHRLMAKREKLKEAAGGVAGIVDMFLRYAETTVAANTLDTYTRHLQCFCNRLGKVRASALTPARVTAWSLERGWNETTRHNAIGSVLVALRWAVREGHMEVNPIEGIRRPTPRRRELIMTREQVERLIAAVPDPFRDFLQMVHLTGARPSEIMRLEAAWIVRDERLARFPSKTTRKTGRLRELILNDEAMAIVLRNAAEHPEGPIFRNRHGRPWNTQATSARMIDLAKRLGYGKEATVEAIRHGYITDALEAGVPIATVSTLAGHVDTTMVARVYGKLQDRKDHLREAVAKIRPTES